MGGKKQYLLREMNGKVRSMEISGVFGKWDVDGVKANGEYLVDICAEMRLRWESRGKCKKTGEQLSMCCCRKE